MKLILDMDNGVSEDMVKTLRNKYEIVLWYTGSPSDPTSIDCDYYAELGTLLFTKNSTVSKHRLRKETGISIIDRCTNIFLFYVSQHGYPCTENMVICTDTRMDYYLYATDIPSQVKKKDLEKIMIMMRQEAINQQEMICITPFIDQMKISITRPIDLSHSKVFITDSLHPYFLISTDNVTYVSIDAL